MRLLDRRAADERIGLVFIDEHGHRRDYRFREIVEFSRRYAGALQDLGLGAGDRVLLCAPGTAKALFALLALRRIGADAICESRATSKDEIARRARAEGCSAILAARSRAQATANLRAEGFPLPRWIVIGEEIEGFARLDRLAEHAPLFTTAAYGAERLPGDLVLESGDRLWDTTPFDAPDWIESVLATPWSAAASTVLHDHPLDSAERLDLLRELEVTVLRQGAGDYAALAPQLGRARLSHLRRAISSDEPASEPVAQSWRDALGMEIETATSYTAERYR